MASRGSAKAPLSPAFDLQKVLESAGVARSIVRHARSATIFAQGDPATEVMYLQRGRVKLSVLSPTGREAVVAILGPGDFFGEGCLAGQTRRISTASALTAAVVLAVEQRQMIDLLHDHAGLADRFLTHMLARNIRIEADLVDQLFNSSEKRLARALLLLARYGQERGAHGTVPKLSQATLADMIGTTRSRVNFFLNKFRNLGFIDYNGEIRINSSLLSVVLHE